MNKSFLDFVLDPAIDYVRFCSADSVELTYKDYTIGIIKKHPHTGQWAWWFTRDCPDCPDPLIL
jgi:hypothetical protein